MDGEGSDGVEPAAVTHAKAYPHLFPTPPPGLTWTCTSYTEGTGPTRPTGNRAAYREVRKKNFGLPPEGCLISLLPS